MTTSTGTRKRTAKPKAEEPTPEVADLAESQVVAAIDEAKRSFSLKDRLNGFKGSTKSVMVFMDLGLADEAAQAHQDQENRRQILDTTYARIEAEGETDTLRALLKVATEGLERAERAFDAVWDRATADALEFDLRYLSKTEVTAVEKEAKKALGLAFNDRVPPEQSAEYNEVFSDAALAHCIICVRDADGAEDRDIDAETVAVLRETIPNASFATLETALNTLIHSNRIAQLATDNPGF